MMDGVHSLVFFDEKSNTHMRYIYKNKDQPHPYAGWIFAKNPVGEWQPLRKATIGDLSAINKGVHRAHAANN